MPIIIEVPVNRITHLWLTALSKTGACMDPDDPATNPVNYEKMRKEIYRALLFYMFHRILYSNDVIFMNPAH
jgi:hypothetical protein